MRPVHCQGRERALYVSKVHGGLKAAGGGGRMGTRYFEFKGRGEAEANCSRKRETSVMVEANPRNEARSEAGSWVRGAGEASAGKAISALGKGEVQIGTVKIGSPL